MFGGRVKGCFHQIGEVGDKLIVAEGYATAASIHTATGLPVLVAFNCGNLEPVAAALREHYPSANIIIAADEDDAEPEKGNPGVRHAMAAARKVKGTVAVPNFGANRRAQDTDFNDLAALLGGEAVKRDIDAALKPDDLLRKRLLADPHSSFTPGNKEELRQLGGRDHAAFERLMADLRKAGVRTKVLSETLGEIIDDDEQSEDEKEQRRQVDVLVEYAADAQLFHTADGIAYADILVAEHRETWRIDSRHFKRWLTQLYYKATRCAPSPEPLRMALTTLDAKAASEGPEREVFFRVGGHEGLLYIDLGNEQWQAIQISTAGWRVVENPPIRFRRSSGMRALPTPVTGGSIAKLRPFLNVKDDNDFVLAVAWVVAAMRDRGPYPVLSLHGPAGAAKSTFSEVVRRLVDPAKPALRSFPRELDDLFIAATNGHTLVFENVSTIPSWLSDALCILSTGGGFAKRELYTTMDEALFDAQKPIVLNGIEDFVVRGDLADRCVMLTLEPIPEDRRKHEAEFWAEFDAAQPMILGALLDALARGLRNLPNVKLKQLPRMADFMIWATACESGAPWVDGTTFEAAYAGNRESANEVVLEDDPVAQALIGLMANRAEWSGTATELLAEFNKTQPEVRPKGWPRAGNRLSGKLRRVLPQLAAMMAVARKHGRYGFRDSTMILLCYRHGLRASELCRLQWHDIDWERGLLRVRRVKNGTSTDHPLTGRELRALRKVKAEQVPSRYIFVTERGAPMSPDGFYKLVTRLGAVTKLEFELHPHMLRHACGYKLANDGQDTRAIQHYLGHKDIRHTCRYTDLSPTRFTGFWKD